MSTTENLFQIFSQVFIESQQSFSKCDVELRTKCRTLSEKLTRVVEELESDAFNADLDFIASLEEEALKVVKIASELEHKREYIKESVGSLRNSTQIKVSRRR
tara:strand:+ start:779 stop:1087 length:309 start_codon:yes stop_codon:yes gene_type:complete